MKRCPQCLFLYPESDEKCDFDQTPLELVDEAEVEKVTGPISGPKSNLSRRALPVAVMRTPARRDDLGSTSV